MPLFEYDCRKCGAKYERMLTSQEAEQAWVCSCGAPLTLLASAPAWFPSGKYGKGGGN